MSLDSVHHGTSRLSQPDSIIILPVLRPLYHITTINPPIPITFPRPFFPQHPFPIKELLRYEQVEYLRFYRSGEHA